MVSSHLDQLIRNPEPEELRQLQLWEFSSLARSHCLHGTEFPSPPACLADDTSGPVSEDEL